MPVSDAKKKANARWNASKDNIMIRPTKEEGAAIRAAAIAAGQSNQQYILQATRERMSREAIGGPTRPVEAVAVSLYPDTLKAAQEAAEAAGETIPQFIGRAIQWQAKEDIEDREAKIRARDMLREVIKSGSISESNRRLAEETLAGMDGGAPAGSEGG